MVGDWKSKGEIDSPRVKKALAYGDKMAEIVNGSGESWDALEPLVNTSRFVRRGNERTELDWKGYRGLLDQWQQHAGAYEKSLHRASEVGDVVYLDLDEKATAKDGSVSTLRSMSVYEFDEADKIVGVDVIMGFHQPQG